ncbi:MAG: hypothetical protein SGPRY_011642, partial [Prymnesium sp.]
HQKTERDSSNEAIRLSAVSVAGRLAKHLKPHQVDAIRFMWSACMGLKRQDMLTTRRQHGVVLAHSMGLGKTLSVCAFLHTILTR